MAILDLVIFPDKKLQTPCSEVVRFDAELKEIASNMLESMYHYKGIGLAANQVGIMLKIFTMDIRQIDGAETLNDGAYCFVNPVVVFSAERLREYDEGCLSFPGQSAVIDRPDNIKLEYFDLDGKKHVVYADGIAATCIQHEIDHLNGIVMPQRVKSIIKKEMMLKKAAKNKR